MIARLAQFAFKPGSEEFGLPTLRSHLTFVASFPGCRRAYLGRPIHGQQFLLYSEWSSPEDLEKLEAALRNDPRSSSDFFALLGKLIAPPHIAQYEASD